MKKIIYAVVLIICTLSIYAQDSKPSGFIPINSPQWFYNTTTYKIGMYKGSTHLWNQFFSAKTVQAKLDSIKNNFWSKTQITEADTTRWSINSGSMVYPSAGIAVSTGSAWATSLTDNSANWNTAYNDRLKWDGGSTGLVAATGRTSLGGTTIGQSMFILANPSAIRFPRFNADNTVSALSASDFKTAIGVTDYVFGVSINGGTPSTVYDGNVLNFNAGTGVTLGKSGLDITVNASGGSMVYPGAGIPLSTGSAWGTSITDNSANWNTAASNIGQVAVGAQYPGGALGYLASSSFSNFNGIVYVKTATTLDYSSLPVEAQAVSHALSNYSASTHTHSNATTSAAGFMSATDKTSLDGLVTDKGKVKVESESAYGLLSNSYFYTAAGITYPIVSSTLSDGETAPVETNAVYDGLALKANLSGASFTGAISSTSTMTATDFILSSDMRLKTKIKPLNNTSWVRNIPLVSYQFKSDSTDVTRYGVIAQDVQTVNKNLVHKDKNGNLSVSYIDLLIAKIADLEKRVSDLETQVKSKK